MAHFISLTKTTPLSLRDKEALKKWAKDVTLDENVTSDLPSKTDPRLRNIPEEVKPYFVNATSQLSQLEFPRQRRFARCVLIKLGQWAIDCRSHIPPINNIRLQLIKQVTEMLCGLDDLVRAAKSQGIKKNKITSRRKLFLGTVYEVFNGRSKLGTFPRPKLILTSPPYPGVHVLYHRWQVSGRRETPAPYWLADLRDGHGESFYTLGGRSKKGIEIYFTQLSEIFRNVRQIINPGSLVVQLVAFSDPEIQLPAFLRAMNFAGYEELTPFSTSGLERPCREVPNRKWYTQLGQSQSASNEILLFHRPII